MLADGPDRRVLVTGAAGFVGSRLLRRLESSSAAVMGLVTPGVSDNPASVDLADGSALARVIADFRPTTVVHLAAMSSVGDRSMTPDRVWEVNFNGTRALAKALLDLPDPARLIFASSAEVYGRCFNDGPRDEASALSPVSPYARTKAACEYLLADMAGPGLAVTVLRLFNHTGPGQDERFAAPSFAAQIARLVRDGGNEIGVGNLEAVRDFSDVEDILDAYVAVIEDARPTSPFEVYNVGSGRPISIRTLLQMLIEESGRAVEATSDPDRMRPSEVPRAEGVFDKFRDRYGWSAGIPLRTTAAALLRHEIGRLHP